MKVINADKLIEKLSSNLDNPEEFPVISLGTLMRMIDAEEEIHTSQQEIIRCRECRFNASSHKCLNPESFFLVPDDNFYCGYAERRTDEQSD